MPYKYLISVLLLYLSIALPVISGTSEPGRFQFISGQSKVEIPFYTFNNQVILPVVVNDKVALNFILDSGSSQAIFFDRKLAQNLGIGFGRRIQFSGVGNNNNVSAFRSRGVKLGLPGIEGHMMGMAILATDYMDMKRFDIHGVIGYQLFARFAVKIDYQQNILTLMEPSEYDPEEYQSLEVEIANSKPYINSVVLLENNKEVPLRLMIDTGGSFGLSLINDLIPGIQPPENSRKVNVGNGLGGKIQGFNGKALVKLSELLHKESPVIFINKKEFSRNGKDLLKHGSIGNSLLKDFVVIFDYVNSRLLFQPHDSTLFTKNQ